MKTSKNEFYKDGLGDLLDFCDNKQDNLMAYELDDERPEEVKQSDFRTTTKKWSSNRSEENKRKLDDDLSDGASSDHVKDQQQNAEFKPSTTKWVSKRLLQRKLNEEQSKRESKQESDDLEMFDEEDDEQFDDDEELDDDEDEEFNDEEDDEQFDDEEQFDKNDLAIESKESKLREDIYGRMINEEGQVVKEDVKRSLGEDSQAEKEVTKKVRGLLNRMALKTLPFIVSELEQIFQKHSNNLVCRCLFNCIDQLVIKDQILAPQKLCTELSMLIAICHSRIGEEVSANILHQLVRTLDEMFERLKDDSSADGFNNNKEFENLIMMICLMYGVNIISDELIYNILDKLTDIFNSKAIELILFCLKLVGYLLRKDNTSMMKSLILNVQQRANSFDKEKINEKKVMFMLNALTSIKNNVSLKMDLSDIQSIVPVDKQTIKTDLKSLFKDINVSCLKGKYNEILKSNRWFVHSGELLEISMKRKIEQQKAISIPTLNDKLCKKLQLTTPFRKLIFNTIYTCEDYMECSQNIIKSTKKDHFEVVLICIHICLSEKQFNPFYVHLLRYLAHIDRNYKRGMLFNVREKIKNMNDLTSRQQSNLEKLVIELIKMNVLPLLVFDVIDFKDMTELYKGFMCNILENLFKEDLNQLDLIFKKLPKKGPLSTSIKVFISIFLPDECKLKLKKIKTGMITDKIF